MKAFEDDIDGKGNVLFNVKLKEVEMDAARVNATDIEAIAVTTGKLSATDIEAIAVTTGKLSATGSSSLAEVSAARINILDEDVSLTVAGASKLAKVSVSDLNAQSVQSTKLSVSGLASFADLESSGDA